MPLAPAPALPWLGVGQLFLTHTTRASSTVLPRCGVGCSPECAVAGKGWGQLSHNAQLCIALGHHHGPRQHPSPGISAWPLLVTRAPDINTDPCCFRTTNPDMALSVSMGRDLTMAVGGSAGYLRQASPLHLMLPVPPLFTVCNRSDSLLPSLPHILADCSSAHLSACLLWPSWWQEYL